MILHPMPDKKLIYVTHAYPGDLYSEKVFVDAELPELRRHFSEIVLVPSDPCGRSMDYESSLPEGVTADWSLVDVPIYHSRLRKLIYAFHPFTLRALAGMIGEARSPRQWLKGMFQAINAVRAAQIVRKIAKRRNMTPDDTVLFSMWFHDPAAGLARLALKDGWKMASHAHTSDIFDDRMLFRSRKLRARLLKGVSYVFTISRNGRDYMRKRFPEASSRIIHHPIGSTHISDPDNRQLRQNSDETNQTVSFTTVARLDPIKCLDIAMDVLDDLAMSLPDKKLRWTIIGDGTCLEALRRQSENLKSGNLEVIFTGALDNADLQREYDSNTPDWYLMMSRSEGLPVSMGEAMSHSIPVITTDVGDISELVTPECALLMPPPFATYGTNTRPGETHTPIKTYVDLIRPLITDSKRHDAMARAARLRWETLFDATRLSAETARLLAGLLP